MWESVIVAAIIDNSPRMGMSFFMGAEPLGSAPANITTAENIIADERVLDQFKLRDKDDSHSQDSRSNIERNGMFF